jgi:hypothetical protein
MFNSGLIDFSSDVLLWRCFPSLLWEGSSGMAKPNIRNLLGELQPDPWLYDFSYGQTAAPLTALSVNQ